jgi:hypothetical protein
MTGNTRCGTTDENPRGCSRNTFFAFFHAIPESLARAIPVTVMANDGASAKTSHHASGNNLPYYSNQSEYFLI